MPPLKKPRWEAFAQAIVIGIANGHDKPYSQGRAYQAAGFYAKGMSAEVNASRLLKKAKPIFDRVRELQAIAATKATETPEKIAGELNEILAEARADKAHSAAVSAALGKAKVLGLEPPSRTELGKPGDFSNAKSVSDIGRLLLAQVGFNEPSQAAIDAAVAANEQFIERLQAIRDRELGDTLEH